MIFVITTIGGSAEDVFKGLFSIPDSRDGELESMDEPQSNLLVDRVVFFISAKVTQRGQTTHLQRPGHGSFRVVSQVPESSPCLAQAARTLD